MEEIKVKGIVIKSTDYKDSDKLVTIFSAEKGLIKARVRGVKKDKAKLAFAVQPFAFIEFMLTEKSGFYTVINASSIDQFFDITYDFDSYIFALACLEVCEKTVKENDSQPELFILLLNILKKMCYEKINPITLFIKFMIESLKLLGFHLELSNCACCGERLSEKLLTFSFDYNGYLCPKCFNRNGGLELNSVEYKILKLINESSLDGLETLKFSSREDLVSIVELLIRDFRLQTDEEIECIKKFL